ncbi:MAG: DUF4115 domain-containing protein [Acidobacteria bacterium]|nr:DUF4115 domain-containing protein [Acidobacteriota bacterium]
MQTLGQRLREEREKRGLSIDELAAQTRIHADYFRAIEKDDTSSLPGGFFYRSFVRQYARLMELPESVYQPELDRSLAAESSEMANRETALPDRKLNVPRMPTGKTDRREETRRALAGLGILILVMAACTGAFTLYQRWSLAKETAELEAAHQASTPPQAGKAAAPAPPPPQETAPPAQPQQAPSPEVPQPSAQTPSQPEGPVRVIVRATELSWVGVWQGQKILFSSVMQAGETRGFGVEDKMRIRIGNAGGVELEWNGKQIPAPGPRGQVRTLDFWSDGYSVVQPPAPKPEDAPPAQPGLH